MSRTFTRILSMRVEGEIYDSKQTAPESIIRNYNWSFRYNDDGSITITGNHHKDARGKITRVTVLPKIHRWKKPDTEFFLKM